MTKIQHKLFLPVTKPRGIDKTSVDASPCLEGMCSAVVLFEDVPPACPLSRVLNEEDESCERALTEQWTMEVAAERILNMKLFDTIDMVLFDLMDFDKDSSVCSPCLCVRVSTPIHCCM